MYVCHTIVRPQYCVSVINPKSSMCVLIVHSQIVSASLLQQRMLIKVLKQWSQPKLENKYDMLQGENKWLVLKFSVLEIFV